MVEFEDLLTKGLLEGYVGKSTRETTVRAGVKGETSHWEENGGIYHDEWFAHRTGGGQEIVRIGEKAYTRLYNGGTLFLEKLSSLGLTKKDVSRYLKRKIQEADRLTRLHQDYTPKPDDDWQYEYRVLEKIDEIPFTAGREVVLYRGELVFIHYHLLGPIE